MGFQILFYATPIMYPDAMLRNRNMGWLIDLNPIVPFLQLVRQPLLEGRFPSLATYGIASATVLLVASAAGLTLVMVAGAATVYTVVVSETSALVPVVPV